LGGPLSKLCVTPPFSINFRCQIENPDTILEEEHPRNISAKIGLDWLSSFRGEDFFKISSPLFSNLHNRSKGVMGFTSKLQGM
jgi:hypothetical protein